MTASFSATKHVPLSLIGLMLVFPAPRAQAVEWSAEPSVELTTEYNDNLNYARGPHKSVVGYALSPQVTLKSTAELWSLSGLAKISRSDYPSNSVFSHTDHFLDFAYQRRNELNQWALGVNLDRDSTLARELAGTGVPVARAQRTSNTASPSWTHTFTERDSATLGYTYNDVTYSEGSRFNLLDYKVKDPSISWQHILSEKDQLHVTFDYSDYVTKNPVSPISSRYHFTTKSAQVEYQRSFTDSLKGSLVVGLRKTGSTIDSCFVIGGYCFPVSSASKSNGSLFTATLAKQYENSSLTGSLSRSLHPIGTGGLVQTDHLSVDYNNAITPRLNGTLGLNFYNTRAESTSTISSTNRYYSLAPAFKWRMTEWWTVGGTYSYAVSRPSSGASARQNAMFLTVDYTWPRISSSH